jgi:alpha-mannosidase
MQFGAINTGRYQAGALPQSTHIFSWPMNNYWVTNFNADQRGGHQWTYYFTSSGNITNNFATHFGWGSRIPFLTRVLSGEGTGKNLSEGSFIRGWPSNVILISSQPAENGNSVFIHLRETDGRETSLNLLNGITGKPFVITETDATGSKIVNPVKIFKPFESKFFLLNSN